MRPTNGAARESGGPHEEKHNTGSNRVDHIVAGYRTRIDAESGAIVWTESDAAKVIAFIRECEAKEART